MQKRLRYRSVRAMGVFPRPGADVSAYVVGGCNAVGLVGARDREHPTFVTAARDPRSREIVYRDAADAFDHVRELRRVVGRRRARKWVARIAREVRRARGRERGRTR